MAKRKKSSQQRFLPEWQRRTTQLIRMADHGNPLRLEAEQFDIQGRDRSWNLFAQNFLSANQPSFSALDIAPSLVADSDRISLQLRPRGTIGAVPLRSPTTRKIIGGIVVRPRFGWNEIGPLLHQIGWTASPQLLELPLVPGAAKEVPPWVLAGPILQRLRELLVDCWSSRLQELLRAGVETANEAYDLLALWAKLRRTRRDLTAQLLTDEELAQVDALLADKGQRFAREALAILNPRAWLEEAEGLAAAFDEPGPLESRSTLAEQLLTDLDDAELVLHASRRFAAVDPELEADLLACQRWLTEHVGLFLAASVHVQAVGMAIRPDLAEFDYGLAATALKYVDLLHAAALAERDLFMANVPVFDAAVIRELAAKHQRERQSQAAGIAFLTIASILRDRMSRAPLARAREAESLEPLWWWTWCSPAGNLIARLTIPPRPASDEEVVLEFVGPDQRRATGLAGQEAILNGVEATIDRQATATFLLARLLQTDKPLVLQVGPKQDTWRLKEAHANL